MPLEAKDIFNKIMEKGFCVHDISERRGKDGYDMHLRRTTLGYQSVLAQCSQKYQLPTRLEQTVDDLGDCLQVGDGVSHLNAQDRIDTVAHNPMLLQRRLVLQSGMLRHIDVVQRRKLGQLVLQCLDENSI